MTISQNENEDGSSRRREILQVAAQLFAKKGYRGTSMRDIGRETGVLGGSLYHHVKSKDALFVELHNAALDMATQKIAAAAETQQEPWLRFEAACVTLLEVQLDPDSPTLPMMNDFREVPPETRKRLIVRRDEFEAFFKALIDDLPLAPDIDRSIFRILLLSQINAAGDWYHKGRLTPGELARQIVRIFRGD